MTQMQTEQATIVPLLNEVLAQVRHSTRMADDVWSVEEIAAYLKLSVGSIRNHVLSSAGFPSPVNLPSGGRRWLAKEVRAWVEKRR